jgi:hypothetical protein
MARTANEKKPQRCLIADCEREALHHGLCRGCYQAAARRVRAGQETWAGLEAKGLASPNSSKPRSPFTRAYKKVSTPHSKATKRVGHSAKK